MQDLRTFFGIGFGLALSRPSGVRFGGNCLMAADRERSRSFPLLPQLVKHRDRNPAVLAPFRDRERAVQPTAGHLGINSLHSLLHEESSRGSEDNSVQPERQERAAQLASHGSVWLVAKPPRLDVSCIGSGMPLLPLHERAVYYMGTLPVFVFGHSNTRQSLDEEASLSDTIHNGFIL